jgi:hypothetical protein
VKVIWDVPAFATARAISDASGVCTSYGTAFGCAKAKSQAAAWAAATAEAHAGAYAEAFNGCGICKDTAVEASASAEVYASTFVQLMADVYSKAEIEVCVAGTQSASATAWSMCFADAFARLVRPSPLLSSLRRPSPCPVLQVKKACYPCIGRQVLKGSLGAERKGCGKLLGQWQLRAGARSGLCERRDRSLVHQHPGMRPEGLELRKRLRQHRGLNGRVGTFSLRCSCAASLTASRGRP